MKIFHQKVANTKNTFIFATLFRGIVQSGQYAWFGTKRSQVRILLPRQRKKACGFTSLFCYIAVALCSFCKCVRMIFILQNVHQPKIFLTLACKVATLSFREQNIFRLSWLAYRKSTQCSVKKEQHCPAFGLCGAAILFFQRNDVDFQPSRYVGGFSLGSVSFATKRNGTK